MLDIPSISVSFILHALLVAGLLLWNTAGEKKPRVEYNFLKANVVVRQPPKLAKDDTKKPAVVQPKPKKENKPKKAKKEQQKKKKQPAPVKPKSAPQPKSPAKPQPKPAKAQPKPSAKPQIKPEPAAKKPEPKLPEIDLPVISEWSSVLAEEEASLEAASQALDEQAEAEARALEIKAYYVELIRNRVGNYWSRPLSARNGMVVVLSVRLLPDGTVHRVSVAQGSGSAAFDRSCLQAIQRAGTLPVPEERDVFNRYFKKFSIQFRPEDLQQ